MTQDDIDDGRLILDIGVAPVHPAEFVIFRFSQNTTDVTHSREFPGLQKFAIDLLKRGLEMVEALRS